MTDADHDAAAPVDAPGEAPTAPIDPPPAPAVELTAPAIAAPAVELTAPAIAAPAVELAAFAASAVELTAPAIAAAAVELAAPAIGAPVEPGAPAVELVSSTGELGAVAVEEDREFAERVVRPALGPRFREAFWASVFGGGACLWLFALAIAMHKSELLSRNNEGAALATSLLFGVSLGTFAGFRRPVSGYGSLVRRLLFVLGVGSFSAFAVLALVLSILHPNGASENVGAFGVLVGLGIAAVAAAMARFGWLGLTLDHLAAGELAAAKRRRLVSLVALGLVSAGSLLGVSPGARCYAGSAASCVVASQISDDQEGRIGYARIGCSRGDAPSCARAGMLLGSGSFTAARAAEIERLIRRGCAMDGAACTKLKRLELEQGCADLHAFACLELANDLQRGGFGQPDPTRALEIRLKACRLGLDDAC